MARKSSSTNKKMCEAYPEWTESKFQSFIKSALRSASTRWPPRFKALNAARRGKMINAKTGRLAEHYECAECHGVFPAKDVVIDHISPVIATTGFTTWDDAIYRMYCHQDNLQVLCKDLCHKAKSKKENEERKAHNNNNKA